MNLVKEKTIFYVKSSHSQKNRPKRDMKTAANRLPERLTQEVR